MITVHQTLIKKKKRDDTEYTTDSVTTLQGVLESLKAMGYAIEQAYFRSPKIDEPHAYIVGVKE
jgi:hypothetical protein